MKKLTKIQQGLYDSMKAGVVLHYMPYSGRFNPNAYYFRNDNMKHCTAPAKALLKHGLIEKYDIKSFGGGHMVRIAAEIDRLGRKE